MQKSNDEKRYDRRMRRKYPWACGKIVDYIREEHTDYGFEIIVQFTDKTAMGWTVRPKTVLEPELMDWRKDPGKTLRSYPALTTRS